MNKSILKGENVEVNKKLNNIFNIIKNQFIVSFLPIKIYCYRLLTSNYKNIDLSKLNNGVYFVKIVSDKSYMVKRVVLSK